MPPRTQTVSLGAPVAVEGKRVDPRSLKPARVLPLQGTPQTTAVRINESFSHIKRASPLPAGRASLFAPQTVKVQARSRPIVGTQVPTRQARLQPANPTQKKEGARLNLRYLDVYQGMNAPAVYSMLEDRRGTIWFGTVGGGVSRYDGNSFAHITTEHGLSHNVVKCMLEDARGHLWFGTLGGGLNHYDGEQFVHYSLGNEAKANRILSLLEDQQGRIWIGTDDGIYCLQPSEEGGGGTLTRFLSEETSAFQSVLCLLQDREGAIWMGTWEGAVRYWPDEQGESGSFAFFTGEEGLNGKSVVSMYQDRAGNIWFGTNEHGLTVYHPSRRELFYIGEPEGLSFPQVSDMLEDKDGNLWLATDGGGVNKLTFVQDQALGERRIKVHRFNTENGLSHDNVLTLLEDRAGNIWFGTWGGGVNLYQRQPLGLMNFAEPNGFPTRDLRAILDDEQGNLWLGTWGEGLVSYQFEQEGQLKGRLIQYTSANGLGLDNVLSMEMDRRGNLWVGTAGGGATYFDRTNNTFTTYTGEQGLSGYGVNTILEDRQGNVWMGIDGGGVTRFQPQAAAEAQFVHFTEAEGLPNNSVSDILEDRQGRIWLGTRGGAVCFRPRPGQASGNVQYLSSQNGLSNDLVVSLFEDSNGHIWLGTWGGGLNRYEPESGRLSLFTTENGLNNNWIMGLAEDKNHNIWVNTLEGFTVMIPVPADTTGDMAYELFPLGEQQGLMRTGFWWNNLSLNADGRLWWGTANGLATLRVDEFFDAQMPPEVFLQTLHINGAFLDYRRLEEEAYRAGLPLDATLISYEQGPPFANYPTGLSLSHDYHDLTFEFSAIDWTAPENLVFTYELAGPDGKQRSKGDRPYVSYTNLSQGTYTLSAWAHGTAGQQSQAFRYVFRIRPPWWLTWWAKSLYAALALGLVYGIVRWRTTELKQRQKELEETVEERTAQVVREQQRSDELLLNILPASVAKELKETGQNQPVFYEEVSILFTDFKGYTNIVASIPGRKLVKELDEIFKAYDDIIEEVGLEKIQTVGDAFVAAGGLPEEDPEHAIKCVEAGKKIIAYLENRNQHASIKWQVRVGIHSGPITAGVIGRKKFSYDLFGDSINIAARMESSSEAGKINISAYTHDLIKHAFACTYRGKINAKGKGELDMYFVN